MTTRAKNAGSVGGRATIPGSSAALGGSEVRMFLALLAAKGAKNIDTAAREDAAIDAEAILTQADEALVLG
jgi:hypothetical protein